MAALIGVQAWAGGKIEFTGKVCGLTAGVVTIEDKYQATGIKLTRLSAKEQRLIQKELAANGEVTVHVPPKAIVKQTTLKKRS